MIERRLSPSVLSLLLLGVLALPAAAAVVTETVTYELDGVVLEGYLAYCDATEERRPGILVVHQWMGLSENERRRARMLAELGYVAFACDIYGKDVRPNNRDEAREQAMKYYGDLPLYRARLEAGLRELAAQDLVDDRLAAIGYCFGGKGVLELARAGADVAGVVSFHGNLDTTLPAGAGDVKASLLVCHGAADPYVTREAVEGFIDEMEEAEVDYQLIMYAGAVHAFTEPEAGDDPTQGAAYQEAADRRSWAHMQLFLDEVFARD